MKKRRGIRLKSYITGSFRRRLTFSYVAIAVVPLVLFGFVMIATLKSSTARENASEAKTQLESEEQLLAGCLSAADEAMQELRVQEEVGEALAQEKANNPTVTRALYQATEETRDQMRFDLLAPDGTCLYTTKLRGQGESLYPGIGVLYLAEKAEGQSVLYAANREDITDTGEVILRKAVALMNEDGQIQGYITASITEEELSGVLASTLSASDGVLVLNRWYEKVYETKTSEQLDLASSIRRKAFGNGTSDEGLENYTVLSDSVGDTGLYLVFLRRLPLDAGLEATLGRLVWVFALLSLAICIAAAVRTAKSFTSPIESMNAAMEEVKKGNLSVRIPEGRKDELGQLSENFNAMTERIDENMKAQVENEKQLNEVRIAMMQAQLNPHFLYNTLDTIKWLAKAGGIPEIADMTSRLAKILRTAISGDKFIPLSGEFALCENYAKIANVRFSDKYHFTFDLPEELADVLVPKMVLQPVLENACIHGLGEAEEGEVWIRARVEGKTLVLSVEDNGQGMDEQMLARIREHRWDDVKGHIGLSNVDRIVRINYGNDWGLRASLREGGGTLVEIVMPAPEKKKGEDTCTVS